jgi:hypothetical protein
VNLYNFVRIIAERSGLSLPQRERERIVGTLRTAGFSEDLSTKRDKEQALGVVTSQLRRAGVERGVTEARGGSELFKAIRDLNSAARCGKCKGETEPAKLSNGEEINYCPKCRATMWKA